MNDMVSINTKRLTLRPLTVSDTDFIFELYNTSGFKRFVGDKQLHSQQDARNYLTQNLMPMYETAGMGLLRVGLQGDDTEDDTPIGICGLIKRDSLEDIDLGYGYLPAFEGHGFAFEAAEAMMTFAREEMALKRLVAITDSANIRCIRLLTRLGFGFEGNQATLPNGGYLTLYGITL